MLQPLLERQVDSGKEQLKDEEPDDELHRLAESERRELVHLHSAAGVVILGKLRQEHDGNDAGNDQLECVFQEVCNTARAIAFLEIFNRRNLLRVDLDLLERERDRPLDHERYENDRSEQEVNQGEVDKGARQPSTRLRAAGVEDIARK